MEPTRLARRACSCGCRRRATTNWRGVAVSAGLSFGLRGRGRQRRLLEAQRCAAASRRLLPAARAALLRCAVFTIEPRLVIGGNLPAVRQPLETPLVRLALRRLCQLGAVVGVMSKLLGLAHS